MIEVSTDTLYILAVDPGKITGWATANVEDVTNPTAGEVDDRFRFARYFRQAVGTGRVYEVVCEDFIISERTIRMAPDPNALRLIGWLELECEHLGIEFTLQAPAAAKGFATDDKLKTLGWYENTPGGHRNDALRHLLRYMIAKHPHHASEILNPFREED